LLCNFGPEGKKRGKNAGAEVLKKRTTRGGGKRGEGGTQIGKMGAGRKESGEREKQFHEKEGKRFFQMEMPEGRERQRLEELQG